MRNFGKAMGAWLIAAAMFAAANTAAGQQPGRPPRSETLVDSVTSEAAQPDDELPDEPVEQVTWLQQPPAFSAPEAAGQAARRSTRGSRQANVGLASVPNMFGDLAGATSTLLVRDIAAGKPSRLASGSFSLPIAGGGSRIGKISENDSPIPRDRVFFNYNHFQNVFQLSETPIAPPGPTLIRQEPIDRYTLGAEKTFLDGWTSVEVRMPLTGSIDAQLPSVGFSGGNVGNLTVVLKSLLYMDGA